MDDILYLTVRRNMVSRKLIHLIMTCAKDDRIQDCYNQLISAQNQLKLMKDYIFIYDQCKKNEILYIK